MVSKSYCLLTDLMIRVWREEGWIVKKYVKANGEGDVAVINWETHAVNLYPHSRKDGPIGRTMLHELLHITFAFDNEDVNHDQEINWLEEHLWRGLDASHRLALEALAE